MANIIIPTNINPKPERFEYEAAGLVADFFGEDAEFIGRRTGKTPDIVIGKIEWEIKSPIGKGKRTILHQFERALSQSQNIIIDARRCKLHIAKIRSQVLYYAKEKREIKRVLLITKTKRIEVIK